MAGNISPNARRRLAFRRPLMPLVRHASQERQRQEATKRAVEHDAKPVHHFAALAPASGGATISEPA
jgi:hypothetical protein